MITMDDEKRAKLFVDLYKQQMEHYQHTQTVEWKGNFGIWTLLAGAIYLAKDKVPTIRPLYALVVLVVAPALHLLWLFMVLKSEQADKTFWVRYRQEALEILRGTPALPDETVSKRGKLRTFIWLASEVGVTVALCVALLFVATRN
jgi:hypothetical protein